MENLQPVFEKIWEMARPYLQTRNNESHTRIAVAFAKALLQAEGGDEDIVIPAVMLHDVGWSRVPESLQLQAFGPGATMPEVNRIHEEAGAEIASAILQAVGYPSEKTEEIAAIIEGHDSRPEGRTLNDTIVKDADKLWRYSEDGVSVNQARFDFSREAICSRLERMVDEWFLTPTGRSIALQELARRRASGPA